jgi:hypothetical protein
MAEIITPKVTGAVFADADTGTGRLETTDKDADVTFFPSVSQLMTTYFLPAVTVDRVTMLFNGITPFTRPA